MQFYGQFNPPVDQFIFERYFPDLNIKGVFVECGSYDGLVDSSCKFFEESAGWTGFNIEAVPHIFERLKDNRPNCVNINAALSNEVGRATFRHAVHPTHGSDFGNGSLSHSYVHLEDLAEQNCTFEEFEVETLSWVEFIRRNNIRTVDVFVLDVEGHELSVIDGMRGSNVLPGVICIEFGHIDFGDITSALGSLGYVYDIHSNANAYFIRADLLPLFAFRAASKGHPREDIPSRITDEIEDVRNENSRLEEAWRQTEERYDRLERRRWTRIGRKLGFIKA